MDEVRVVHDLIGALPQVPSASPAGKPYWLARRLALIRASAIESGTVRLPTPKRRPRRGLLSRIKSGTIRAVSRD